MRIQQATFVAVLALTVYVAVLIGPALNLFSRRQATGDLEPKNRHYADDDIAANNHIYLITPTYRSSARELHVLRLASQLALVPNLTWFIVEDDTEIDSFIEKKLNWVVTEIRSAYRRNIADGFSYIYTHAAKHITRPQDACRGLEPRFHAVRMLFSQIQKGLMPHGTLMFMDDDNVYAYHLLADLRRIRKISLWPGGNFDNAVFNFPLVSEVDDNKVNGMYDDFDTRRYPVDMANFGISTKFAMSRFSGPNPARAWLPKVCSAGTLETRMLEKLKLKGWEQFETGLYHGTRVGFWHTRTAYNALSISRLKAMLGRTMQASVQERLSLLLNKTLMPLSPYQAVQQDIQLLHR